MFFPIDDYLPYFPHIFQKPSTAAKRLNLIQYRLCHQLGGGGGGYGGRLGKTLASRISSSGFHSQPDLNITHINKTMRKCIDDQFFMKMSNFQNSDWYVVLFYINPKTFNKTKTK